ncbi:MAG TPA: hypothetical protein VGH20_21155 [Myxococcales bacterium]
MKRRERGLTFISVLLLLGVAAGVVWLVTFGPAYWDNQEVKSTLNAAANLCYQEHNDAKVRAFIMRKLQQQFGDPGFEGKQLAIDLDPQDLRIERTQSPKHVDIWLTYSRTVKTPFVDQERTVTFSDHADQDLSDVKW